MAQDDDGIKVVWRTSFMTAGTSAGSCHLTLLVKALQCSPAAQTYLRC
jgi:hypothetical protein